MLVFVLVFKSVSVSPKRAFSSLLEKLKPHLDHHGTLKLSSHAGNEIVVGLEAASRDTK